MTWPDALPNLLIGLREGLEAGLVVSILLAALRKSNTAAAESGRRQTSTASIWLGVLGAVMVAGSFAAVLTYSTSVLTSAGQEAVGGLLSVVAVGLVTAMVFWMRRTARGLSAHLRGEVSRAVAIGAGALTLTAFLAVGREGLETTLFLWTAVRASGQTFSPLVGAALGLAAAVVLCALLYRQAVRIDLGTFFTRTAYALIVIAAGVLSYGLGDLQDAGLLSGGQWVAFDLSAHLDPNAWWVSIISGITDLSPRMTVLQVAAWAGYLVVVVVMFARSTGAEPAVAPVNATQSDASRWERLVTRRTASIATALIAVPALIATTVVLALPSAAAADTTPVTIGAHSCAPEWSAGHTGAQSFQVDNKSGQAGEIDLVDASGGVVAEIETIGPATTATMSATLGPGQYTFTCLMSGGTTHGSAVALSGSAEQHTTAAVTPVTLAELTGPNVHYQAYAAAVLRTLATDVAALRVRIAAGDLDAAKALWLTCQLDWERVGASYDSFGDAGTAVDGLPDGLPKGVDDPGFTGLHRIEYELYHGQSAAHLLSATDTLAAAVRTVQRNLRTDDEAGDPTNLPLRVHEVLEDALRDHLSGIDDQGAGAAYPMTYADTQVTRVLLTEEAPLIEARSAGLVGTLEHKITVLQQALLATRDGGVWPSPTTVSDPSRQRVNAAIGTLLESLSIEPDLLELPPTH